MIKYNLNTINDWNFGDDNIIKVYYDNAVCYYKVITSGGTTAQTPCFAVVDNISQYQETEFEDVFNKADESWYKLNNLLQYEKYGLYGSGLSITTYEGKLTVDSGNEYIYSGSSWVYVGEVSGGTAQLPDVPFTVNYNAKNYDSTTKTLAKTSGQLADVDAVISGGTPTVHNNYITIATNTRALITGYQQYFNRDNSNPNLTIISKQLTDGSNCHLFANRANSYNWMYRAYNNKLTLHGTSEQGSVAVTTQPVIESVRVDSNSTATYNNYTDNTSSTYNGFTYGDTNLGGTALFSGYYTSSGEWFKGDFYWIYMSQSTLTDEQVQQVIDYNEDNGGGETIYPLEYTVKSDPPNNVTFSSMTEAEEYECPYVGMNATIDGDKYVFSGDSISGYEWVYNSSRLPQGYTEVEYIRQNSNYNAYINTGVILFDSTNNTYTITTRLTSEFHSNLGCATIISCEEPISPYNGLGYRYKCSSTVDQLEFFGGNANYNSSVVDNGDGTRTVTFQSTGNTSYTTNAPLSFLCSFNNSSYTSADRFADATIYSSTIVKNGITVRDFVPAKRDSDSVYGVYDLINDVFYTSPNGNNFIGGSEVTPT